MTDKPPAMLELPEPELGYIETDKSRQPAFSARQMREAMQSAQPAAAVSDEEIEAVMDAESYDRHCCNSYWPIKFARAILALRPQAVPLTEDEFVACLVKADCIGVVKMSYDSGPYYVTRPSINASKLKEAIEAHYGITAPAGGKEQA